MNYYASSQSINDWVKTISHKFNDISLIDRDITLSKILNITSASEITKIKKASMIAFSNTVGVTSFETACLKLGQSSDLIIFQALPETIRYKFISEYKLITIIKALNEGWWPDFTNGNEDKFWNYWYMNNKVFSLSNAYAYYTITTVPSALYLKNRELAVYAAEIAYEEYKAYYL